MTSPHGATRPAPYMCYQHHSSPSYCEIKGATSPVTSFTRSSQDGIISPPERHYKDKDKTSSLFQHRHHYLKTTVGSNVMPSTTIGYTPAERGRYSHHHHYSFAPYWSNHSPSRNIMVDLPYPRNLATHHGRSAGYRQFPSNFRVPDDFLPPSSSPLKSLPGYSPKAKTAKVTPNRLSPKSYEPKPSKDDLSNQLRKNDIVCGRGAPSQFQPGNYEFRQLISEYQTAYLCATRCNKPKIALEVIQILQSRKSRFVRRVKTSSSLSSSSVPSSRSSTSRFVWEEIDDKRIYDKVCMALREGAGEFRLKMMSMRAKSSAK